MNEEELKYIRKLIKDTNKMFWLSMVPSGIILLLIFGLWNGNVVVYIPHTHNDSQYTPGVPVNLPFTNEVKNELAGYYNSSREYSVCLDSDANDLFNVTKISNFVTGDRDSVQVIPCAGTSYLHSHPIGSCAASNADVTIWRDMLKYGIVIYYIQCDKNKFVVYTQEDFGNGILYEVELNESN
jgi:proteasome lid subunit RPN8/RPN11